MQPHDDFLALIDHCTIKPGRKKDRKALKKTSLTFNPTRFSAGES